MFERLTDRARKVMALANQEAQRLNHDYIGAEHILLGVVKVRSGVGAAVLKNLDVDLRTVRLEVEKRVESGPDMVTLGRLPQTIGAKKVIECAIEESRGLNHTYIGSEHLLLGLVRQHDGVAAEVLKSLGVTIEKARTEIHNILGSAAQPESGEPQATPDDPGTPELSVRDLIGLARDDEGRRRLPVFERLQSDSILRGHAIEIIAGTGLVLVRNAPEFAAVLDDAIRPAMARHGIAATKSHDLTGPRVSLAQVWEHIRTSQVIVADLSGQDASVMFELGLCFGLHRLPILLVRDSAELPVELRSPRSIEYEGTPDGIAELRERLTRAIELFLVATRHT